MPLFSGAPNSIQQAIPNGYQPGGILTPGYYSNLAFQMAGRPQNGPYSAVAPPPDPAGGYGIPSGTNGTAGGAAGGLLGALAQNPNLAKGAYNAVSGLLGSAVGTPAWEAAINAGTAAGVPAVAPIAAPTAAEVASSIGAPASGALYAGADAAPAAGSAAGSATGSAAASGAAEGAAAGTFGPAASAGIIGGLLALGPVMDQLIDSGSHAQSAFANQMANNWMKATGAQWVQEPGLSAPGPFGLQTNSSGQFIGGGAPGGYIQLANGQKLTNDQAYQALRDWVTSQGITWQGN